MRHTRHLTTRLLLLLVLLPALSGPLLAADRALLIGVGQYANPAFNLEGIDIDVNNMQVLAERLGFAEIRSLQDQDATAAQVEQVFKDWLIPGVGPNDRVLIYYSGHGTQVKDDNGDETDGADEVLVMHDAALTDGKIGGVLRDDLIYTWLSQIPSQNIMVLVDACNSGTVTKNISLGSLSSGVNRGQSKFLHYEGMPSAGRKEMALDNPQQGKVNYVALSAAADNERALATSKGSLFTRAVTEIVEKGLQQENKSLGLRGLKRIQSDSYSGRGGAVAAEDLTLERIHREAKPLIATYIGEEEIFDSSQMFHPQLSGNLELAQKALMVRPVLSGEGPEWQRFRALADGAGDQLKVSAESQRLEEGDLLQLRVETPGKGYLNILQVNANDQVTVLYPNGFDQDNQVGKGLQEFPGPRPFDWVVQEPFGPNLIIVLFSRRPLNLYQASSGARDASGKILDAFTSMNAATTRNVVAAQPLQASALQLISCADLRQCGP
ncbi:caspase family protein [Magnetovirga frankeli]|uniref:caspase family protein n=1 Tax=Magnetovirga frankeli TaxID=947516 RepID=UPI0012933536|nr:caspase family protein [gamma proteobacterium SS-5]